MAYPTLATNYDHEILGNEYCSGYADVFSQWNTGFYCPQTGSSLAVYCCGTSVFKYCCTTKQAGTFNRENPENVDTNGINSLYISDTPVLIAVACGVAAVIILTIIASCFFCSGCFVYKKRSNVPGMYRMQDSSTTSGLANCHRQHATLHSSNSQQSYNLNPQQSQQQFTSFISTTSGNYLSRPVLHSSSPTPQEMTCFNDMIETNGGGTLDTFIRGQSNSSLAASPVDIEWSQPHQNQHQPSLFHINNNLSTEISSNHLSGAGVGSNLLPPPTRFASNQNLSLTNNINTNGPGFLQYGLVDKSNPRDVLLHKQNHHGVVPYSLETASTGSSDNPTTQGHLIQRNNYCTATLPSCLRRSTGSGFVQQYPQNNHSFQSSSPPSLQYQPQQQQPQLKSILRNPRNASTYSNSSMDSAYRRANTIASEYDFSESLLPLNITYVSTGNYNERPLNDLRSNNYNEPYTTEILASSAPLGRPLLYSSPGPMTEYQNDLNRLDKELDLDSLDRLIELDLDSKL